MFILYIPAISPVGVNVDMFLHLKIFRGRGAKWSIVGCLWRPFPSPPLKLEGRCMVPKLLVNMVAICSILGCALAPNMALFIANILEILEVLFRTEINGSSIWSLELSLRYTKLKVPHWFPKLGPYNCVL